MSQYSIYILPISGGGFPVQIAELSVLYQAYQINNGPFKGLNDYAPDLMLGASGGNVAAYVALGGDFSYNGMRRILENVSSEMFVQSWWPGDLDFIPTWFLTAFSGSLYRAGKGPDDLLKSVFNHQNATAREIFTLAFNTSKSIPQIFSNYGQDKSIIPEISEKDKILFNLSQIDYLNGDVDMIAKVCMASAAIPIITQPQFIENDKFNDGGLAASSPFSLLSEHLYLKVKEMDKKVHLFYFASYDMDNDTVLARSSQYGPGARATLASIINSRTQQDRANAVSFLERIGNKESTLIRHKDATVEQLAEVMSSYSNNHYLINFYPDKSPSVKLTKFGPDEVIELVDKIRAKFNFDLWFIE